MSNKNYDRIFYKYVIIASIIIFLISIYPIIKYLSQAQINSVYCGYVISLVTAIGGYKLNSIAFNRSVKSFMVLVFGGIGIRLIFVIIMILILIQFNIFEQMSLAGSVFFFYIIFISIEIYILHKKQLIAKELKAKQEKQTV